MSRFGAQDHVLEVGPGRGELTLPLARQVARVTAVEKDPVLADILRERLVRARLDNVSIHNHDILRFDFQTLRDALPGKCQVIGNLPYNISSPFLEKLVQWKEGLGRAVLMFQLEVARRLTASPGGKAYGALTLLASYHARPSPLFTVPREAFRPVPKVQSMVMELDFEKPCPGDPRHAALFRRVVKGAFSHRRKTLLNSLAGFSRGWDRRLVLAALAASGIEPSRRAETLDMDEFLRLTEAFALTHA
jgi:16S rRNA (adenine1518-N6/adenine1519-N6)-dimethyltransferase